MDATPLKTLMQIYPTSHCKYPLIQPLDFVTEPTLALSAVEQASYPLVQRVGTLPTA